MNWCPVCNTTAEETVCPQCGGTMGPLPRVQWGRGQAIGALLEAWPRDDRGEREEPVFLCHCTCTDMEDQLAIGKLQAYGIPVLAQMPGDGAFGALVLGISGFGVNLFVPASQAEDARELMKEETEDAGE